MYISLLTSEKKNGNIHLLVVNAMCRLVALFDYHEVITALNVGKPIFLISYFLFLFLVLRVQMAPMFSNTLQTFSHLTFLDLAGIGVYICNELSIV